jgi:hypothetical protein
MTAVPIRGLRLLPSCENYFGAIETRIESEPRPAAESRNRQNRNPVCDPDSDSGSDPKLSARGAASSDCVAIAGPTPIPSTAPTPSSTPTQGAVLLGSLPKISVTTASKSGPRKSWLFGDRATESARLFHALHDPAHDKQRKPT